MTEQANLRLVLAPYQPRSGMVLSWLMVQDQFKTVLLSAFLAVFVIRIPNAMMPLSLHYMKFTKLDYMIVRSKLLVHKKINGVYVVVCLLNAD